MRCWIFINPPADKSNMARYLFVGFTRCLYAEEKFQSDTERKLAVILYREALKWLDRQGPIPDFLPKRCRPFGIPARLRSGDSRYDLHA